MTSQPTQRHPLSQLDFTSRVRKRAQYEAFEFTVTNQGVLVRNGSYVDPENHEYRISVEHGVPTACTCPADSKFDGACKHRVAVAIRRPVLDAVAQHQVVADGGASTIETTDDDDSTMDATEDDHTLDEDDCEACQSLADLPCWDCFRSGVR